MVPQSDVLMWAFMEEAVIRDRGCDEERFLSDIVRSYLTRRGLAATLATFDSELEETCVSTSPCRPAPCTESSELSLEAQHDVETRKRAQLLCLSGRYEAAADALPPSSALRIKLLSLEALRRPDQVSGMSYATTKIAPLVPTCEDTQAAHRIYLDTVSSILGGRASAQFAKQAADASSLCSQVNQCLLKSDAPSALNILLSWADWQVSSTAAAV